jgi:predicted unusual protein kinase regulating ubiquinone biosynthesis (AarF/ABC1/UbiB family)
MHLSLRPEHVSRYRELAVLLVRYGRSDLVRSAGLDSGGEIDAASVATATDGDDGSTRRPKADELAADLERLGPTFVKIGQLVSSRSDLLPAAYADALSSLQDQCAPFGFADVERIVQNELRARLSRIFVDFDTEPVAAAFLGQVHRAVLRGGRTVAVKVQRPAIREQMGTDLEVLCELVDFFNAHSKNARRYAIGDAFEQFRRTLLAELDYRREAANLVALSEILQHRQHILVPAPYDDFTTSSVLTMDFVHGRKVTDITPLARLDNDPRPLADELFGAYLEQILQAAVFHADPHPGNALITGDGKLALIDVGMVGRLSPTTRKLLTKLMMAVTAGRTDDLVRVARLLGSPHGDFDDASLTASIGELMDTLVGAPQASLDVGRALIEVSRRSAESGLRPAPELALLGKTLINLDQVTTCLDPDFEPLAALRCHLPDLLKSEVRRSAGGALTSLLEAKEFVEELPARLNRVMDSVGDGRFELRVQAFDETQFLKGLHRLANIAAAGLVLAALIIGSALLASTGSSGSTVRNTIALVVFIVAAAVSLVLLGWIGWKSRTVKAQRRG